MDKMTYKVPLIPPNLRKNETIVQIADSLDHLSRVMDDIMLHIEKRVDIYSAKLNNITNRVDCVERKISQLRGSKNALQVFSSSKYPASDLEQKYLSIFPVEPKIFMKRHNVNLKYPLKKDEPLEKLHVYHVQLSKLEPDEMKGLGKVSDDIHCVNDLLLYNSGKNLYKEFTISDTLQIGQPSVKTEETKVTIGIAPASIGDREVFSKIPSQTYFYSPDLGEVPLLDIPLDLPDLPGIADNVRYKDDTNVVIAPSVSLSPSTSNQIVYNTLTEDLEGLPEIIPSPPLQETPRLVHKVPEQHEQVNIVQMPPKIENIEIINEYEVEHKKQNKPIQKLPIIPDARTSLMEAIRAAGGAKTLKSVKIGDNASKEEKSSGDLMADLHAKLAMRRKGISGTQKATEHSALDSRGALNLISALIPAPDETNEESTDVDEEWE